MSSDLGPVVHWGYTVLEYVAAEGTDIVAEAAAVFADAATTVAAFACDLDDALHLHCLLHVRQVPPCFHHTHSHAQQVVYFP